MKRFILFLLLAVSVFIYSNTTPIFQWKNYQTGRAWTNWNIDSTLYIFQHTASDSEVTSREFTIEPGFDGFYQFFFEADTITKAERDTTSYTFNNMEGSKTLVLDTTFVKTNLCVILEYNLGAPFGWKTLDTLEWTVYSDSARDDTVSIITQDRIGQLLTSKFEPFSPKIEADWQSDVPLPFRVGLHSNRVGSKADTTKSYKIKFNYKAHTPNRR